MRLGATICAAALALAATAGAGAPAQASPAPAGMSARRAPLQVFLLASAPDSLADVRAHARSLGVVYPTYFDCAIPEGRLVGRDAPAITGAVRAQHIAVMPRFNCQDGPTVHRILTDPATRAEVLARLGAVARSPAYAGLSLDLENDGAGDREAMSSFVSALARRLHAERKRLSVVVVGVSSENTRISTGFYDDGAIAAAADSVFVLAWGEHWAGSAPGPIATLAHVQAVAGYVASLPQASRFVLGAPMYGLDWAAAGGPAQPGSALQYSAVLALARSVGATPTRDPASGEMTFEYSDAGVAHRVWYLDARAVLDVLRIARAHGLAAGLWRMGREDQRLWSSPGLLG